ncbi:hypothetical protein C8J57DRAFT_1250299 [Mycena rebaudengoi]|nr:hypothetical protein C8J57DRAFT_1250299 [Mycena rebaudengoi]
MKNDELQLRFGTRTGEMEGGRKDSRAGDATSTLRSSFGGYTNRNLFPWIKDMQDVSIPKDSRRAKQKKPRRLLSNVPDPSRTGNFHSKGWAIAVDPRHRAHCYQALDTLLL